MQALDVLEACGLSAVQASPVAQLPGEMIMEDATMQALLEAHLPGLRPRRADPGRNGGGGVPCRPGVPGGTSLGVRRRAQFTLVTELALLGA